ncbi:MAG: T9SS type A sorting domain-containing protein [Bacteroidota bacterium]
MRAFLVLSLLLPLATSAQTRYEWVGGNGNWTEAANWSPVGVPAEADTAVVENGSTRIVSLTENTTVARLEVVRLGVIAGNFDLTITDHLLWAGGGAGFETFRGTGTITLAFGATGHLAEGTSRFQMTSGRTLVNDGTILWDGTGFWSGRGRLVNNGEVILATSGVDAIAFSDLTDAITNTASGVIRRDGPDAARISAGIVNDGLIRIENGTLNLNAFNAIGITGAGTIEVDSGAELLVTGGNNTQARITGETVTIDAFNGRTIVTDEYDAATTRIVGSAGELRLNTDATITDLVMEGGVLGGSGTVTITGSLTWTGGAMEGSGTTSLGPTIPLTISGDATIRLNESRTLRTEGTVTWTGDADLQAGSGDTTFENAGTLTSSGPGERFSNFLTFRNTGTVIHDGGLLRFGGPMHNEGDIRIESGTIGLASNGTDTGRYEIADAGRLEQVFQTRRFTESVVVEGTGTFDFRGGTLVNRATWLPGSSPGTLTVDSDWPAMQPEGVLDIEVGGPTPGTDFDQIAVNGAFEAGGTVRLTLSDGFTPGLDDRFLIVSAAEGATGSFDVLDLPDTSPAGYIQTTSEGVIYGLGTPVASEESGPSLPEALALHPPAPNPSRRSVRLNYALPDAGDIALTVYDALGRSVAVLVSGSRQPGEYETSLDTSRLAPGPYLLRLGTEAGTVTRRLTVVR